MSYIEQLPHTIESGYTKFDGIKFDGFPQNY